MLQEPAPLHSALCALRPAPPTVLRFDKAFDIKKDYKAKGCYAIHTSNCDACEIIVESNVISSIQSGGKKVEGIPS